MIIDGEKYGKDDLVLTMELVQAPIIGHDQRPVAYTQLTDPEIANQLEKEKKKLEMKASIVQSAKEAEYQKYKKEYDAKKRKHDLKVK